MKKAIFCILIFIFIALVPFCVNADQLIKDDEWSSGFHIYDMKKDAEGNYYLVGEDGSGVLKKYDSNRNLILTKRVDDSRYFESLAFDDADNIYILYREDNTYFRDPDHNITKDTTGNDLFHTHVLKLDSDGNTIFDVDLDAPNNFSLFLGIEVYDNNLYITGNRHILAGFSRIDDIRVYYNYEISANLLKMDLSGNIIDEIVLGEVTKTQEYSRYVDDASGYGYFTLIQPLKERTSIYNDDKIYTYKTINNELFLGVNSKDLTKINAIEFGNNSCITDISETDTENFMAVGSIDVKDLDPSAERKSCPVIVTYSPGGNIISYKIAEGRGEFLAISYKDNGYYGIVRLYDTNINEYNNDSEGYFLVRYDLDYNVQAIVPLSRRWVNTYEFEDEGVTLFNEFGTVQHYHTYFDYKVNVVNSDEKGRITINEDREYYQGEEVSFNIEVNDGYKLKEIQVLDNDGNRIDITDNNTFIMPSSDVTITPVFKKIKNSIRVIDKNETQDIKFEIEDITEVRDDEVVKMYITAVAGYTIDTIIITDENNNEIDYTENENEYSFIMPDCDVTIDPYYVAISNMNEENTDNKDGGEEKPIVEKIKTEVSNAFDKLKNPNTEDKISGFTSMGLIGIIILMIVISKRRKHSTKKISILY